MPSRENDSVEFPRPASHAERENGGDFFCLRFGVWYPSVDCAYRTHYRPFAGCENCDQGRFNARRHPAAPRARWSLRLCQESPSNATG